MQNPIILNSENIEFSHFDIKRNVKLPIELNQELAELIGIVLGDGNIYMKNNRYELHIYGDLVEDREYHEIYIKNLIKTLFNINPIIKEKHSRCGSCIVTEVKSRAILSFLTSVIELQKGKKENIKVPSLILNSNEENIYRFIRGLADTDFYLKFKTRYQKKNYYPIIIGNLSCEEFVKQLKLLFERIGFHSHIENRKKQDKTRNKTYYSYAINIVGKMNLEKWMQKIGFSNKKHLTKYEVWKKLGYCPTYTNISKREALLNKK